MPLSLRYIIVIAVLLATILPESHAQRRRKPKIWEGFSVTGRVGANHFFGDLVDDGRTHLSLGINADKELNTFLTARASIMGGKMSGTQYTTGNQENAWFDNIYTEFNVGATFRPLNILLGYYKQRTINPYVIGQIGALYYNATKYWGVYGGNFGQDFGSVWNETSGITPTFSGGFGLSLWLNSQWSINIEGIGTFPFTDELDAHKEYELPGGGVVQTEANDFYYTTSIGITYLIDDSRWKNEPKYNRKAYLKTRSQYRSSSKKNLRSINKKRRRR
ncbi:hypothetical protein KEM09_13490 [Carboxylicivirga mesophila]|uniref:Outer membrane protein beta-barrel domain-containing protein n=1 Tax=Carboxylicivirga mesophila TaxID=1166478 RepID=A0ABS5KBK4_9BACT|nr:hypothetical protein [Carboxylicivirga mesophila]MBS2212424.1 hypothetical protein [Carboxylicivirga mesophila]